MKTLIKSVFDNLGQNNIEDSQFCWKYLKYFSIHFSKDIARNMNIERRYLENKLKTLETSTNLLALMLITLDKIYEEETIGIRIKSKCDWCKQGKKSSNFFSKFRKISSSSKSNSKHLYR